MKYEVKWIMAKIVVKEVEEGLEEGVQEGVGKSVEKDPDKGQKGKGSSLVAKEILDRVGYGFGSQQFVNILFFLTGASFLVIGLVNGARVVLSTLSSFLIQRYSKVNGIGKKFIGMSGILFGFSFLLIGAAIFLRSVALFSIAVLLGSISIVPYGEFYQKLVKERDRIYYKKLASYGLIVTALSLFIAAYIMDMFPITGTPVEFTILGKALSFRIYGYIIAFEATALSFIFAGYILSFIGIRGEKTSKVNFLENLSAFSELVKQKASYFLKNKVILTIIIAGVLTSIIQTIGNSYYGIFVYTEFTDVGFGGFLNVAMVFLIAVFSSILGSMISKMNSKSYGKFPTLFFGTALMGVMPLSYYYNPSLITVTMGTISGVIGAAMVGVANGLLTLELIREKERGLYFSLYGVCIVISYIILIPILAYFTQLFGLSSLFLLLALMLGVVAFLYIIAARAS